MIKNNEIMDMWKEDSKIDNYNLDETSRNTPLLHAKYFEIYNTERLRLKALNQKLDKTLKLKWLHYNGKLDKEQIDKLGWKYNPFEGLSKPLKSEMSYWYNADEDLQQLEAKIEYCKINVDTLKEIVESLKWRHQTIKNIVEWTKFTNGS